MTGSMFPLLNRNYKMRLSFVECTLLTMHAGPEADTPYGHCLCVCVYMHVFVYVCDNNNQGFD